MGHSGARSPPRQMVHCRPRVGAVPTGCGRSVRAQVLSCTDCSRARVGVYHRTWAGGTAAPSLLLQRPAASGRGWTRALRAPPAPGPSDSRSTHVSPSPGAAPRLPNPPGESQSSPAEPCPRPRRLLQNFVQADARPASSRVRAEELFCLRGRRSSPAGPGGTKFPSAQRATCELAPPARPPVPPAPYPQPRGLPASGGRRRAPCRGGRGPLPRVRTWPGLRPLHSARRLALTAPPHPAPRPPGPPPAPPRQPPASRPPLSARLRVSFLSPRPFPPRPPSSPLRSRSLRLAPTLQRSFRHLSFPSPSSSPQSPQLPASSVCPRTGLSFPSCLLSDLWVWFAPTSAGCPEASRKHRQSPVCLLTPGRYRWDKYIRSSFGSQRQFLAVGADEGSS